MPWDHLHKLKVQEEEKNRLASYLLATSDSMAQINKDISYYRTCQKLDGERSGNMDLWEVGRSTNRRVSQYASAAAGACRSRHVS